MTPQRTVTPATSTSSTASATSSTSESSATPVRSAAELRDALRVLPPSAKLVAKTLEYEGRLTQSRLAAESRLPQRTVRHALCELEERGIVVSSIYLADARKRIYALAPPLRNANESDRTVAANVSD